jgi:hypothetical protein
VNLKKILAPSEPAVDVFRLLSKHLETAAISVRPFSEGSLKLFETMPREKQAAILEHFKNYMDIISSEQVHPDRTKLTTLQERSLVRRSLSHFGLSHTTGSEETVESGYLIEVYNNQNVQLYRNLEFFRHSGYSLMDVVTTEWFKLYQRPQRVTEDLLESAKQVFIHNQPVFPKVPIHILREVYSKSRRAFLMDVKSIFPLVDVKTGQCTAILTKIKAELIAEGSDYDKIGIA